MLVNCGTGIYTHYPRLLLFYSDTHPHIFTVDDHLKLPLGVFTQTSMHVKVVGTTRQIN